MKPQILNNDTRPQEQPEGSYPYGKNGVHDWYTNAVMNEPGFDLVPAELPYTFNGVIETDKYPIIFSTDNTNSAIGWFDASSGNYIPIVDDNPMNLVNWPANGDRLGFHTNNYITGEAQRNYKGEVVISFTDKVTFPKYLNCDLPSVTSVDDLRLFPIFKEPTITVTEGLGGTLSAGSYYVAVSYEKNDGTITSKSELSNGTIIAPGTFGTTTDKSLLITITDADPNYNFVRIYVVARSNDKLTAVELSDSVEINNGTAILNYTGTNLNTEVSVSEVLVNPAVYERVRTMGQLNDALYIVGLEKEAEITDMQPYANMVQIKWKSELVDVAAKPEEYIKGMKRSLMHEEVYAIYIQYHKTKGGWTQGFHVPGLAADLNDLGPSSEASESGYPTTVPRYKVEDRIATYNVAGKFGSTGKWINENEFYPNDASFNSTSIGGPNLMGANVRHHKMPSLRWAKKILWSSEQQYGITKLDALFLFAENVQIPSKYNGIIDGYRLLFAKRTPASTLIQGQALLLNGCVNGFQLNEPTNEADIYTSGGNWRTAMHIEGSSTSSVDYEPNYQLMQLRADTFRLHSFDLLFNKPSITPTFLSAQLKLRRNNIRTEGYLEDGSIAAENDAPLEYLIDYTKAFWANPISYNRSLWGIKESFYLENGFNVRRFDNARHEACFAGTLKDTTGDIEDYWPLNSSVSQLSLTDDSTGAWGAPEFEESYLVNVFSLRSDVYNSFMTQNLIPMGPKHALADNSPFYWGDTFLSDYSYHTYGRHDSIDVHGEGYKGTKVIRRHVCETISNVALRYEIPGNMYSKWYPKTPVTLVAQQQSVNIWPPQTPVQEPGVALNYITYYERSKEPNQFGYSRDLHALNDFLTISIFNPKRELIDKFPFRIHRGGKLSRQNKRSWRTFLPLDYYELQKNMGFPISLNSYNDQLIIHHERALFQTQDKAKLESGLLGITLGTGDIFQFEPKMSLDTKLGYAGTQHELACCKIPIGYAFIDVEQGQLFILSQEGLNDITDGLKQLMENYLNGNVLSNNPFIGHGVTIGWDERYKRLLVTVKGTNSYTFSYNSKRKAWAFAHDYIADMYFHTRTQLYSVKDNLIYRHNTGPYGQYYYNYDYVTRNTNPFFIDVVFRAEKDMILEVINWKTEFINPIPSGQLLNDQLFGTLTHISVWNSNQHSGRIALEYNQPLEMGKVRRVQGGWAFHDFRNILINKGVVFLEDLFGDYKLLTAQADSTKPWYSKELMNDTWFCVRFEFDNISNKPVILHDVSLQAQISSR